MKYRNITITLGFIVLIIQFLGFPQSWDDIFYVVLGLLVIAFGYLSGKEKVSKPAEVHKEAPVAAAQA